MTLVFFYHAEKVVYEVKVRARLGMSDNDDEKGRYRHESVRRRHDGSVLAIISQNPR